MHTLLYTLICTCIYIYADSVQSIARQTMCPYTGGKGAQGNVAGMCAFSRFVHACILEEEKVHKEMVHVCMHFHVCYTRFVHACT